MLWLSDTEGFEEYRDELRFNTSNVMVEPIGQLSHTVSNASFNTSNVMVERHLDATANFVSQVSIHLMLWLSAKYLFDLLFYIVVSIHLMLWLSFS